MLLLGLKCIAQHTLTIFCETAFWVFHYVLFQNKNVSDYSEKDNCDGEFQRSLFC